MNPKILKESVQQVPRKELCLDIGTPDGLSSAFLCENFKRVIIWEPSAANVERIQRNLFEFNNWTLYSVPLGKVKKKIDLRAGRVVAGNLHILHRLDDYGLRGINYIKLTANASELFVIQGGLSTIKKSRPVILLNNESFKNKDKYAARDFLLKNGYKIWKEYNRHGILIHRKNK